MTNAQYHGEQLSFRAGRQPSRANIARPTPLKQPVLGVNYRVMFQYIEARRKRGIEALWWSGYSQPRTASVLKHSDWSCRAGHHGTTPIDRSHGFRYRGVQRSQVQKRTSVVGGEATALIRPRQQIRHLYAPALARSCLTSVEMMSTVLQKIRSTSAKHLQSTETGVMHPRKAFVSRTPGFTAKAGLPTSPAGV